MAIFLDEAQVGELLDMESCIAALEEAFREKAVGNAASRHSRAARARRIKPPLLVVPSFDDDGSVEVKTKARRRAKRRRDSLYNRSNL